MAEGVELLTPELQSEYMAWEELFNSAGWEILTRELREDVESLPDRTFRNAENFEQVLAARAAKAKVAEVLNYPTAVRLRFENAVLQAQQAEEDRIEVARPYV